MLICEVHRRVRKKDRMCAKVLERLLNLREVSSMDLTRVNVPTMNTLIDRMSFLLSERNFLMANMEKTCGVEDIYGEHSQRLDFILNKVKE